MPNQMKEELMDQIKTIIKKQMREENISVRGLAKLIKVSPSTIQSVRDGGDCKVKTVLAIFKALKVEMWIEKDGVGVRVV